jgi:NAD+ synthase (glutamine-hydrolysing)
MEQHGESDLMILRVALVQINTIVGDLVGNRDKILAWMDRAREMKAEIVAFPEMAITGYPPEDLLLKPDFVEAAVRVLHEIVPASEGLTAIVGCVYADDDLCNAAAVLHNGQLAGIYRKQYLPNYGVFDENRYFRAGQQRLVFSRKGYCSG